MENSVFRKTIVIVLLTIFIVFLMMISIKFVTRPFQKNVIIATFVVLILSLIIISYYLVEGSKAKQWPPLTGNCPDYWIDTTGDGKQCKPPTGNADNQGILGTCSTNIPDFSSGSYSGNGGACAKSTWAKGCGVSWDGITYGVKNPCDTTTTN
jgi:hypothetical protein